MLPQPATSPSPQPSPTPTLLPPAHTVGHSSRRPAHRGRPRRRAAFTRPHALLIVAGVASATASAVLAAGIAIGHVATHHAPATPTAPTAPRSPAVTGIPEGASFDARGFNYATGWTLTSTPDGLLSVHGLRATNEQHHPATPIVTLTLGDAGHTVGSVTCAANLPVSTNDIPAGATAPMSCLSTNPMPAHVDLIEQAG